MRKVTAVLISFVFAFNVVFFSPSAAKADFVGDVLDAAAKAGGWPSDLPSPQALLKLIEIAQGCASDTSEAGLINCVNTAIQDPTVYKYLGSDAVDKIDKALEIYVAISTGDYLTLIADLGQAAGCAAAAVLTGVPVCALAQYIADIAGAIADVAQEVYEFLQSLGAHAKVTADDFYWLFYDPQIMLGIQISVYSTVYDAEKKWTGLLGPLYDSCYDYFHDVDDMSSSNAHETCKGVQDRFVGEVNKQVNSMAETAKKRIGEDYDKMKPEWVEYWNTRCDLPSGSVKSDIDALINNCQNEVAGVIAKGRDFAIKVYASCLKQDALVYDTKACAEAGYKKYYSELTKVVASNEQIAQAFKSDPNSAPNVLKKLKQELDAFNQDAGAWAKDCNFVVNAGDCKTQLKRAWDNCQVKIAKVPWKGDLGQDELDIQKVKKTCEGAYTAVVASFAQFVKKYLSVYEMSKLCPNSDQMNVPLYPSAKAACDDHLQLAAIKCAGGVPEFSETFYQTGKIPQNPTPLKSCDSENNFFKEKWGQDEPLISGIENFAGTAKQACGGLGGECTELVDQKTAQCRVKINTKANKLGLLPSVPAYKADRAKAVQDMIKTAQVCGNEMAVEVSNLMESKVVEALIMQQYGDQCPSNIQFGPPFKDLCRKQLIKAYEDCQLAKGVILTRGKGKSPFDVSGIVGKKASSEPTDKFSKGGPQSKVNQCQSNLKAVIDEYKQKYAAAQPNVDKIKNEKPNKAILEMAGGQEKKSESQKPRTKIKLAAPDSNAPSVHAESAKSAVQGRAAENTAIKPDAAGDDRKRRTALPRVRPGLQLNSKSAAEELKEKGCSPAVRSAVANSWSCKSAEAFEYCEKLKKESKVGSCYKVN